MINEAEQYLNLLIELLADETINKNKDYLQDAYLTKIDFYQKNRSQTELNELKKNIMKKFPGLL
jgi:hypothetical protein